MQNKIKHHKYTEEENEFIRKYHEGLSGKELAYLFNQKFGTDISVGGLLKYKTVRLKLKGTKNTGMFLKGATPWNKGLTRPIGDERVNKDGFVEVKIGMPNVWRLKHHIIYEKHHNEKIGRWDKVIFLDGNNRNFDISNLKKISNSEQTFLAHTKLLGNNPENNKTALLLAKLASTVKRIEKKVK